MLSITNRFLKINYVVPQKRFFWGWVNMMFNKVDGERLQKLGYERCAAEWFVFYCVLEFN